MDDLKLMVVNVALKDMLARNYISICTVKEILAITGGIPRDEDLKLLNALHCINFNIMPQELLRGLPVLLQRVLGSEGLCFDFESFSKNLRIEA